MLAETGWDFDHNRGGYPIYEHLSEKQFAQRRWVRCVGCADKRFGRLEAAG